MEIKVVSKKDLEELKEYKIYLPYLVVALVVILSFSFLRSQIKKINSLRQSNQKEKIAVAQLEKRISQIKSFSDEQIDQQIKNALIVLPRIKDPTLALSAARALVANNNLRIEKLTFSPGKITKAVDKKRSSRSEKDQEIAIDIQTQGKQEDILQLIKKVNQSSPLMNLISVDFNFSPSLETELKLKIYFSPVTVEETSNEENILPTQKEKDTYQKISQFERLGSGVGIEGSKVMPGDPHRDPFIYESSR